MNDELLAIGKRLLTQDNRITAEPMFCVQEKKLMGQWCTIMTCFTEEGCKDYLRQDGHNHKNTRIYAESFRRCDEMLAIRHWLMDEAKKAEQP
jgi:hypothetical protein